MFYIIQAVKFLSVPENIQKAIAANNNLPFPVSCAGYKEKFANF